MVDVFGKSSFLPRENTQAAAAPQGARYGVVSISSVSLPAPCSVVVVWGGMRMDWSSLPNALGHW